jgi:hypothetical protein
MLMNNAGYDTNVIHFKDVIYNKQAQEKQTAGFQLDGNELFLTNRKLLKQPNYYRLIQEDPDQGVSLLIIVTVTEA